MKNLTLFLFLLGSWLVTAAQTPSFKTAVEYNNYIVALQTKVGESISNFSKAVESMDLSRSTTLRENIVAVANDGLVKLKSLPAYKGNSSFKNASIRLFEFYKSCAQTEYKELVSLILGDQQKLAVSTERVNQLVAEITNKEKKLDESYLSEQKQFAKDNDFGLTD
jgi:hypothetical protein